MILDFGFLLVLDAFPIKNQKAFHYCKVPEFFNILGALRVFFGKDV